MAQPQYLLTIVCLVGVLNVCEALGAERTSQPILQQQTAPRFLDALKQFLEKESIFDVPAVEKHFGVSISPGESGNLAGQEHKRSTWHSLAANDVLRFTYGQYNTISPEPSAGISLHIIDPKSLCVRERDVFATFGVRPLTKQIPPRVVHFRTAEAAASYEARRTRPIDEYVFYSALGHSKLHVVIDFNVFECAETINISQKGEKRVMQ